MAEYTYGKDFAIRTETDCIATENDFGQYVGRITAVKIKTNGDRIRQMTDEELAEFFYKHMNCNSCCVDECVTMLNDTTLVLRPCELRILDWLR